LVALAATDCERSVAITMEWEFIESQKDLDTFSQSVCWEDSETLEFYGTHINESYFPSDISRSGYHNLNIHILCDVCTQKAPYLEMVFIDCDHASISFLTNIFISGRVDNLKRIEMLTGNGDLIWRCSRLIFRFLDDDNPIYRSGRYFRTNHDE
jgi:hypothetical protein